jgi:hypothetical protein
VSRFAEGSELIQSWFRQAEQLSVPDAGHMMMVQNAAGLAKGLRDFFTASAAAAVSAAPGRSGTS